MLAQHTPAGIGVSSRQEKEIMEMLEQAKQFEGANEYGQAASYYSRAATVYWIHGALPSAIEGMKKALALAEKIGNTNACLVIYSNLGMIYTDMENFPLAHESFQSALGAARKLNRKTDIASTLINIASTQVELKNLQGAIKTLHEACSLAQEINELKMLRNCYSQLAKVYEMLGNTSRAAEYFSLYSTLTNKIQQDEARQHEGAAKKMVETARSQVSAMVSEKQATEMELNQKILALRETEDSLDKIEKFTLEQHMQIELLHKESQLRDATIKSQQMVRNIFLVILIGVMGFTWLIYQNLKSNKRANAMLAKQNREIGQQRDTIVQKSKELQQAFSKIEKQNFDITSSITYAQRIQQATLPVVEHLTAVIPQSFVFLQPRDIVSGDFYWFCGYASAKLHKEKPRKNFLKLHNIPSDESGFLIAAADCTGHGVPGAFMSMIGFNLLETITRNGTVTPSEILFEMHLMVRYMLKQSTSVNTDGMDMSICCIKDDGRKLLYAGAKNPLIMVSRGEIRVIKPDPVPIGGPQKENLREFTLHTLEITEPTSCYIFTDGFIDQFGGTPTKKFGSASFRELLLEVNALPVEEQKMALLGSLEKWKGSHRQIDDILVLGFTIGTNGIEI